MNKYKDIRYAKGEPPYFHSPQKQETVMKWANLCPGSVLFLFIPSSWGPTVAFTSIFTYTIPASLKLDWMSYKQTIRLWGWDRDRQKVWGIAKLESMRWRSSNVRDDKFVQVCEGLDGIRDVDSGDSTCWSSIEAVIIIITIPRPQLPQQTWPHTAVCNGLHAKSTSLASWDSMWFECMELYPVNCAISTGIFADLCL